jgi:hypothetical protein
MQIDTFEDWLRSQQMPEPLPEHVLAPLRAEFERGQIKGNELRARQLHPGTTGGYSYGVAIEDDGDLRLSLWVKRSTVGECFIFQPRDAEWDPHASYHRNGNFHQKSHGTKVHVEQRQPLATFSGREHLGFYMGHGIVAPSCDPSTFTAVIRVRQGVLNGKSGHVAVDLVEPGVDPAPQHRNLPGQRIVHEETFKDVVPWVVITIAKTD